VKQARQRDELARTRPEAAVCVFAWLSDCTGCYGTEGCSYFSPAAADSIQRERERERERERAVC